MEKIIYPTLEEIVEINKRLGEGGVLVNKSNLEFILEKAKIVKGVIRKATIFLYDIIKLHPFLDGNKRTAFHTMLYFLELNKKEFKYGHKDESKIEKLLNRIARGIEKREDVEKWIERGIK
ncbi:MAG: type II toxin-antitoxin system death-on-curing family toxin [Candidatus Aenigmatarchaeota archaeon]|jgi:death-on-curing family protein